MINTIIIEGHPPIRTARVPEELWLGRDFDDFGGRWLRAVKTGTGELILWYCHRSGYARCRSYDRYVATLPPVSPTSGTIDAARDAYRALGKLSLRENDLPRVQDWLAGLGYSVVADIDR